MRLAPVHCERGRGTKSNGVGTRGKERDLEFRLTEQVYMLCCCSALILLMMNLSGMKDNKGPCIKHESHPLFLFLERSTPRPTTAQ